jgi:hypothetical protein
MLGKKRADTEVRCRPIIPLLLAGQRMPGGDLLSQGCEPQVPSALAGFTSVFGMGTGGSRPLTPPDKALSNSVPRALHSEHVDLKFNPSPRPISTGRLHALLRFYLRPIYLVFYQGPYRVTPWEISSQGGFRT